MKRRRLALAKILMVGCMLVACGETTVGSQPLITTPTDKPLQSTTPLLGIPTPTRTTQTLTQTLDPACDPLESFCPQPGHFLLQRPVAPPADDAIDPTYRYGATQGDIRQPHHGVEFYNASGTSVLAVAAGSVLVAGDDSQNLYSPWPDFYGHLVILEHHFAEVDGALYTLYAHLSVIKVELGQSVQAGEEIGEIGATGSALGSHLHFEVRLAENVYTATRNPELWLMPHTDEGGQPHGALAGQVVDARGNLMPVNLTVQFFPDPDQAAAWRYEITTYAAEEQPVGVDDLWQESFALGDLPAGQYRLTFIYLGVVYERWLAVRPGEVSLVVLSVE